jgi:predicted O-methyltransferase YrrM
MSRVEVDLIIRLAQHLPADAVCVNIGTGPGTSIIALLEARPDLVCIAVDLRPGIGYDTLKKAGVADRVIERVGDSQTMAWGLGGIDWLCIDGDHYYGSVAADIANWTPHARGLVLFHDYTNAMGAALWDNVQQAVNEWAGERQPLALADSLIAFDLRQA